MTTAVDSPRATETDAPSGVFTTTRAQLAGALTTVGVAVPQRPAVSVLAGVLLESNGADLLVRGFDYETAVTVRVAGAATTPGRLVVSHTALRKLLGALGTGLGKRDADRAQVSVRVENDQWATVAMAGTTIPLALLPLGDYPRLPDAPPLLAQVERERFTTETRRVLRAIGHDETLPALTGMKVDVSPHGLTLAATDRYRLTVAPVPATVDTGMPITAGMLIHGRVLGKILPKLAGDEVRLGCRGDGLGTWVSLASGDVSVVTRSIDAEFPTYVDKLPHAPTATVVVNRAELVRLTTHAAGALGAVDQKNRPVTLTVSPASLTVAPALADGGEYVRTPELPAHVCGISEPTRVGVNERFVVEALESFTGDTVTLHIHAPTKPVVLTDTPDGLTDPTAFVHMLMPVRLSS